MKGKVTLSLCLLLVATTWRCRSLSKHPASSEPESIITGTNGGGLDVFFSKAGLVRRVRCSPFLKAADGSAIDIQNAESLLRGCSDLSRADLSVKEFIDKLSKAYLTYVGDATLSEQEKMVLAKIEANLPAEVADDMPDVLDIGTGTASKIMARFSGLFAPVYEGKEVARQAPAVANVAVAASGAVGAAENLKVVGSLTWPAGGSGSAPFNVSVNFSSSPISEFSARVKAQSPNGQCTLTFVAAGYVQLANGTYIATRVVEGKPGTFSVSNGAPVGVRSALINLRYTGTPSDACVIELTTGSGIVPPPGPSPTATTPLPPGPTPTPTAIPPPPPANRDTVMKQMMGSRSHRMWHWLWHGIRNAWPSMSASQKNQVSSVLGSSWARSMSESSSNPQAGKGEEFLHMHRMMIGMLRAKLGDQMYDRWRVPPPPNSTEFPLPGPLDQFKDQATYNRLVTWNNQYKDAQYLRTVSLSQYGLALEGTIHNMMHMRWANSNRDMGEPDSLFGAPSTALDNPANDYLGSTYASHVNPIFWRLHGYVDDRIQDWLNANGYDAIAEVCGSTPRCYQWQRIWDGPVPQQVAVVLSSAAAGVPPVVGAGEHSMHVGEVSDDQLKKLGTTLLRIIGDNSTMFPDAK